MGGGKAAEAPASDELARIAGQLFQQTDPLRSNLIDRSAQFLGLPEQQPTAPTTVAAPPPREFSDDNFLARFVGVPQDGGAAVPAPVQTTPAAPPQPFDVSASPLFGPVSDAINRQAQQTRESILSTLPAGGVQQQALAEAAGEVGRQRTSLSGRIAEQELARAMSLATGAPLQASIGGLGSAGNTQAQLALANAQQAAAGKGALGEGAGAAAGLKMAGAASSRDFKEAIEELDGEEITKKFMELPTVRYRYKGEQKEHIGTFAEDFNEAFGFSGGKYIELQDWLGVVTAVIQHSLKNRTH